MRLFAGSQVRTPDLVTVMIEHQPDGTLNAQFIGEGHMPSDSGGYQDMDVLVSTVDRTVIEFYRSSPAEAPAPIGFQYAWYPWEDDKKALKIPGGPPQFLVFEIRQSIGGYEAWLPTDPAISAVSQHLTGLPSAIGSKSCKRWPALLGRAIPGMLHWNRELTGVGFRDVPTPASS